MKPFVANRLYSIIFLSFFFLVSCGGGSSDDSSPPLNVDGAGIPGANPDTGNGDPDPIPGDDLIPGAPTDPDPDPIPGDNLNTGKLIDSAVIGISYSTDSQQGKTSVEGEFNYRSDEKITFSIGSLEFPSVDAAEIITPVEMAEDADDEEDTITNIARLLQSLDVDGDPDNGIVISEMAAASAIETDFDVSIEEFETDPGVINLVANSGSVNTTLVSAEAANQHLQQSLDELSIPGS